MIARMLVDRDVSWVVLVLLFSFVALGCSNSDSKTEPETGAYLASGGVPETEQPQPAATDAGTWQPPTKIAAEEAPQDVPQVPPDQTASVDADAATDRPSGDAATLFSIAEDDAALLPHRHRFRSSAPSCRRQSCSRFSTVPTRTCN